MLQTKYENLKKILKGMKRVLVAFSGGVDSTFLLKTAADVLGSEVLAVTAQSEVYPERELKEAKNIARKLNIRHLLILTTEMENPEFVSNSPQRCYFCKQELFSRLKEIAKKENIPFVLDGANFEDMADFRPGTQAAEELGIRSPLKEAGFTKNEIRELSKKFHLPTWDKPSMACLASRFPYNTEIDRDSLIQVSQAEIFLRKLGFKQLRVRHYSQMARIEISRGDFLKITEKPTREKIIKAFKKLGYTYICLDLEGYRTGSMNEPLRKLKA